MVFWIQNNFKQKNLPHRQTPFYRMSSWRSDRGLRDSKKQNDLPIIKKD